MRIIENQNNSAENPASGDAGQSQVEVDSQSTETTGQENSQEQTQKTESTDAQGQSQSEESFFDPNSVPEELKPAYKQMQAAFTKKTQELAAKSKESESLKAKADAFSKYEQYIPLIEEMARNQGQQQSPEMAALEQSLRAQGYNDDAIEMMKMGVGYALNVFNQTRSVEKIQNGIVEAGNLDPRLNDKSLTYTVDGENVTYGDIVERYVAADPNWQKDVVAATKKAIKLVDALIGQAKTEGKKELSASATAKANKFPATNSSPQSTADDSQPKTIKEAFKQAQQELGMS